MIDLHCDKSKLDSWRDMVKRVVELSAFGLTPFKDVPTAGLRETLEKSTHTVELKGPDMLAIGTLAKRTGTKVQTIRYYEQIGLMPEPGRTEGGQRRYGDAELDRLSFIRHSRQLGFSLEAIRELLDLSDTPDRSCAEVDAIAQKQLRDVEARLVRLEALRVELQRMIGACNADRVADCRILEVLRDHEECLADHGTTA